MRYRRDWILWTVLFLVSPVTVYAGDNMNVDLTVKKGDCLIRICRKYLTDPRQCGRLVKENRLTNPDLIYPDQKIKFPVELLKGLPADGLVTFASGDVRAKATEDSEWTPLNMNDTVREGYGIKTGTDSSVEITFEDETTLLLKADTTMSVSVARKGSLHFIRKFFLRTGRVLTSLRTATGREQRLNIHTPSAVAAARGTEFRTSVDSEQSTRSEVLQGTIEVGAMMKKVNVESGEGTVVKIGKPPLEPRKLLPPPHLLITERFFRVLPARLTFEEIERASSYRISLARDEGMIDVVREGLMARDSSFEIAGVDDGSYYLQTTSIDSDGIEGIPLTPEPLTIRAHPVPPFINAPTEGSEYRQKNVNFGWLKVQDAAAYHLQIAEDAAFDNIAADERVEATEYPASLGYKSYFFRISSIAEDGYEGVWSDVQRFVVLAPPPSPAVEKPTLGEKDITIRWHDLGAGFSYHFQMATDAGFNEIIVDKTLTTPFIVMEKPDSPGTYHVRTSSVGAHDYEGSFSEPQTFEIKRRFPIGIVGAFGAVGIILLLVL